MKKREKPSVTVDIIIFTIKENDLKVLLVKRNIVPFKDVWALPGGFVLKNESLEEAARRELYEETGVKDLYLEQLYSFGEVDRDPRERVITISYFALINSDDVGIRASTDVSDVKWFSAYKHPVLAFDHKKILDYGLKRLQWKLEYTTIGFVLLPKKFTLGELQNIYEVVFNKSFDKRNFRKKVISLDIIEATKDLTKHVSHRPARLYTFKKKIGDIMEIL